MHVGKGRAGAVRLQKSFLLLRWSGRELIETELAKKVRKENLACGRAALDDDVRGARLLISPEAN